MTEERVKREQSIAVPFLVGGLVGAGIALLLAPKSGKELREDVKHMASSTRENVTAGVEKGKELYGETSTAIRGAIDAGKSAFVEERGRHRQAA